MPYLRVSWSMRGILSTPPLPGHSGGPARPTPPPAVPCATFGELGLRRMRQCARRIRASAVDVTPSCTDKVERRTW